MKTSQLRRVIASLFGNGPLPAPHHTTVPRPWRFYTSHWNKTAGRGARS